MARIPDLSAEAQSFVRSILGRVPSNLSAGDVSAEQADQLLIVLEEELAHLSSNASDHATRKREISELAAVLLPVASFPSRKGWDRK